LIASILLTGASGLIGTRLTQLLLSKGHRVSHLGRSVKTGNVPGFVWNVDTGQIDPRALDGIDAIVHLAGAGVADKRWSASRKKEILDSRVKSTSMLFKTLASRPHTVKTLVSASAIGYYGHSLDDRELREDDTPGTDFLASVVKTWEAEVDRIASLGIRVVKIRIGIVLSDGGGALQEMAQPVRWGIGSPLGTGKQWTSWIHIDDLCNIFMKGVEGGLMSGTYNAVSPNPVTNKELTLAIAKTLHRPMWAPNVPTFVLRLVVGEITEIIVNGSKVSSEKIQRAGLGFKYPDLEPALKHLLKG